MEHFVFFKTAENWRSSGVKLASKMAKDDDRKFRNPNENLPIVADPLQITPDARKRYKRFKKSHGFKIHGLNSQIPTTTYIL